MNVPLVIKLSGEVIDTSRSASGVLDALLNQIKELMKTNHVSLIIGGGNLFRGSKEGRTLGLSAAQADSVGMMATVMNGLILQDLLMQKGVSMQLLSPQIIPGITLAISQQTIHTLQKSGSGIIFVGGTGNPCFTTDTAAVIRATQVGAPIVYKATKVDGVYDKDPVTNSMAIKLDHITRHYAIEHKLGVVDTTALVIAEQHNIALRIFSMHHENALIKAVNDKSFGSTIA